MSKKYRTTVPLDDIGDPADVPHEFAEWSNIDPNEDVELRADRAPESVTREPAQARDDRTSSS